MSGKDPRVCIVGAGMSGILMAIKLQKAGYNQFSIYEKSSNVGGTWRENRYPGVACDVASFSYCYDFEPNPNWTHRFSPGPEIQQYFEGVADKYGLMQKVQFNTEVLSADYDDGVWTVKTSDGEVNEFDVFVAATGPLNKVKYPDIAGLNDFEGHLFHSAEWDDDLDLTGKKIGLIGTGSSGVQMVDPLSAAAGKLTIFQRTPQWIMASPNPEYSKFAKFLKRTFPFLGRFTRWFYLWVGDQFGQAALYPGRKRRFVNFVCELSLKQVKDPVLREKLTPPDEPMCRRMIMSGSYHDAVQRENVHVETESIEKIEANGIRTKDGQLHELDVLVLATGFYPNVPGVWEVTGKGGKTLKQVWDTGTQTYRSITLPEFPNYFMLIGPNSPITNLSLVEIADIGVDYVIQCLDKIKRGELSTIEPKLEAVEGFNQELQGSFENTIWVSGCNSWYIDANGLPATWPWLPSRFRKDLEVLNLDDYHVS